MLAVPVTRLVVSLALRARLWRFKNRSRDFCGAAVAALRMVVRGKECRDWCLPCDPRSDWSCAPTLGSAGVEDGEPG